MRRRDFLGLAAASWLLPSLVEADELPRDVRITRIVGFDLETRRNKVAGKNSHLDVHGDRARDRMVRVMTAAGVEGLGYCPAGREELAPLVGRPLAELYRPGERRMALAAANWSMPFWDLAGKLLDKPVYELLGGRGRGPVPVYDGSIYFADLLPEYADNWQDRFRREIDMGWQAGHRAFKIKIGRGFRWMDRGEGDARDVEVVRLIRQHAGKEAILGVDANNGYDPAGAKRLLDRVGPLDLAFTEELFPETIDDCLAQKRYMAERGWKTLLADGESHGELEPLRPFVAARAIDVLQADMRRFGLEGILAEAAAAEPQGVLVGPHNWGSLVGFYMQLHVARAVPNFYRAEHDPLRSELLEAEGYDVAEGACRVPDAPGFGLKLDERRFRDAPVRFDVQA